MAVTRPLLVAVGGCIALGLAGCGTTSVAHVNAGQVSAVPSSSTSQPAPTTSTTRAPATTTTAGPTATTTPVSPGWKPVTYQSVHFAVPADWPVYDLAADPTRCVTLNVHAVYLGHVGPHPNCPATAVGKTDAVHVEPYDAVSRAQVVLGPTPTTVAGQPALTDPSSATTRSIVVALERSAVLVTLSYNSSPALDQQILATFQANS
ncbi:MAG TPA: hypothetical protein VF005_02070 [Acidimicrobiales bacterium]